MPTKIDIELAERLEKTYAPDYIRTSNALLLARTRLRQIENWRQEELRNLERRLSDEANKKVSPNG